MPRFGITTLGVMLLVHVPLSARGERAEYVVAGDSMSPAVLAGDRVTVDGDLTRPIERGELVAIRFDASPTPLVKRVAAVPGDRVDFREDAVWVNGQKIRRIDPRRWRSTIRQIEHYGNRVPDRRYLVLGDNPLNSRDSGRLGLIPFDRLVGRVTRVTKASPDR